MGREDTAKLGGNERNRCAAAIRLFRNAPAARASHASRILHPVPFENGRTPVAGNRDEQEPTFPTTE